MNNQPIRQHWVPKAYLRAFCAPPATKEQIYTYDLIEERGFKTKIDNIAVKRHLYTIGLGNEESSFVIESMLSRIESDVKPIFEEVNNREDLHMPPEARKTLSAFLSTMFMRTRLGLQMIRAHREEVRAKSLPPEMDLPEPFRTDLLSLDDNDERELFAKSVVSVGLKLTEVFESMYWHILRAIDSHLITSENPLVVFNPTEERWGLGTDKTHIHFPLSPKLVLSISKEPLIPGNKTVNLPPDGVKGINGLTVLGAVQYLFSDRDFSSLRELLADRPQSERRAFGPMHVKET
ncbi:MAG: DUF4238 domain-containing protein [Desulfovermiculus sp.]|nr:DUF4238 domain-containing protein [Desulfovermiculus sp.]